MHLVAAVAGFATISTNISTCVKLGTASPGREDCRFWDLASTAKKICGRDPDFTAGILMRKTRGVYYVLDCVAFQEGPAAVEERIAATAAQNRARLREAGARYRLRCEQEPGSAAVRDSARWVQMFAGLDARQIPSGTRSCGRGRWWRRPASAT
jgi:phage terminase large subunit-like protein